METPNNEKQWYALRTLTGQEEKIKLLLETEIRRLGLEDRIDEVLVPQETVFEVRGGKKRTKVKNFLPGYILIHAKLDNYVRDLINNMAGVQFVGTKSEPIPLKPHEVERILGRMEERRDIATIEASFEVGDPVRIIDGPFTGFSGVVKEVNNEKQKVKVEVGILGRKTPVELDFTQIEIERP